MALDDDDKRWLEEKLEEKLEAKLEEKLSKVYQRIEHVETTLLTEFHKWASPAEARMRTHSAALRAIDLEMEQLAEKVHKLEGIRAEAQREGRGNRGRGWCAKRHFLECGQHRK